MEDLSIASADESPTSFESQFTRVIKLLDRIRQNWLNGQIDYNNMDRLLRENISDRGLEIVQKPQTSMSRWLATRKLFFII
jgi:hypothetical protein